MKRTAFALATTLLVAIGVGCQESASPTSAGSAGSAASSSTAASSELLLVTLKVPNMT